MLRPRPLAGEQFEVEQLAAGEDGGARHLLLGEKSRLDRFREFYLIFCREQRYATDLSQVDPNQVARRRPLAEVSLIRSRDVLGLLLRLEDLHPLLCEHPDDPLQGVVRQVRAIERGSDVLDGHTAALSAACDEVRHLID
ncbi:hypothetical protein GCM10010177_04410 [Actinomadura citrea]|nr:hypothetical protein GCM10010177_04410 [Actinomadura citrea]